MKKRKPHYRLTEIQDNVRAVGIAAFTLTARRNGLAIWLTTEEMVGILRQFYGVILNTHEDHIPC